jgi:hypothetical protein
MNLTDFRVHAQGISVITNLTIALILFATATNPGG